MGKGIGIILIVVAVIVIVAISQNGWDGLKSNPLDSTIQASKTIADTGKDAYDKGKEIVENFKNNEDNETTINEQLTEIGKISCTSDGMCNELISECGGDCICDTTNGICYK